MKLIKTTTYILYERCFYPVSKNKCNKPDSLIISIRRDKNIRKALIINNIHLLAEIFVYDLLKTSFLGWTTPAPKDFKILKNSLRLKKPDHFKKQVQANPGFQKTRFGAPNDTQKFARFSPPIYTFTPIIAVLWLYLSVFLLLSMLFI
jgi:hypothetical protein